METFSALLALCAGNSPVTCELPPQRPVMRSFDAIFDLRLNKRLVNNRYVGDLGRHRAHYDVTLMYLAVTGSVEAWLQRLQWLLEQSSFLPFRFIFPCNYAVSKSHGNFFSSAHKGGVNLTPKLGLPSMFHICLTYWDLNKMADILQTTFLLHSYPISMWNSVRKWFMSNLCEPRSWCCCSKNSTSGQNMRKSRDVGFFRTSFCLSTLQTSTIL